MIALFVALLAAAPMTPGPSPRLACMHARWRCPSVSVKGCQQAVRRLGARYQTCVGSTASCDEVTQCYAAERARMPRAKLARMAAAPSHDVMPTEPVCSLACVHLSQVCPDRPYLKCMQRCNPNQRGDVKHIDCLLKAADCPAAATCEKLTAAKMAAKGSK